jgi:hypothetical protein
MGGEREYITFVAEKRGMRMYIQCAHSSYGAADRIRKRRALLAIRDAWPKVFVDAPGGDSIDEGIRNLSFHHIITEGISESWNF